MSAEVFGVDLCEIQKRETVDWAEVRPRALKPECESDEIRRQKEFESCLTGDQDDGNPRQDIHEYPENSFICCVSCIW